MFLSQSLQLHLTPHAGISQNIYGVGVAVMVGSRFDDLERVGMDIGVNVGVMVGVGVGFKGVQLL